MIEERYKIAKNLNVRAEYYFIIPGSSIKSLYNISQKLSDGKHHVFKYKKEKHTINGVVYMINEWEDLGILKNNINNILFKSTVQTGKF